MVFTQQRTTPTMSTTKTIKYKVEKFDKYGREVYEVTYCDGWKINLSKGKDETTKAFCAGIRKDDEENPRYTDDSCDDCYEIVSIKRKVRRLQRKVSIETYDAYKAGKVTLRQIHNKEVK